MKDDNSKIEIFGVSAASLGFSLAVLVGAVLSVILTSGDGLQLTALLVGGDASSSLQETAQTSIGQAMNTIFGNQLLGRAVVFGLWAFVGLTVFTIASAVHGAIVGMRQVEQEQSYVHQDKHMFRHDLTQRLLFRLGIAAIWGLYTVAFFRFLVSFFVAVVYVVINGQASAPELLLGLGAVVLTLVGAHLHVVLARLFLGRLRIWQI